MPCRKTCRGPCHGVRVCECVHVCICMQWDEEEPHTLRTACFGSHSNLRRGKKQNQDAQLNLHLDVR